MQEAVSRRTLVRVVLEQVDALGGELANVGCRRVGVTNRRVRPAQIVYGVQALFGSVSLGMDEKNTKGRYRLADWRRVRESASPRADSSEFSSGLRAGTDEHGHDRRRLHGGCSCGTDRPEQP